LSNSLTGENYGFPLHENS